MKKYIIHLMVFSCKRATELIVKKSVVKLGWLDHTRLGWHKSICAGCKRFEEQNDKLDKWLTGEYSNEISKSIEPNEALKSKIISQI
ncbi:MAG: hypothetical protein ACKVOR_00485 [Flavobacteriales bacterium]